MIFQRITPSLIAFVVSSIFYAGNVCAQKKIDEKYSPEKIQCINLGLDPSKRLPADKEPLPFKQIVVIDERPDSSKTGYWYMGEYSSYFKLCIQRGFTNDVTSFLGSYLRDNLNSSGNDLLVCVRKFWVTSSDSLDDRGVNTRYARAYC